MLAQQNMSEEDHDEKNILSTPLINKINSDLTRFRTLVSHLRLRDKKQSEHSFHNDSQISNIEPKSERNSFQIEVPMDKTVKKFVIGGNTPISHNDIGDKALKYKPRSGVNGRDDIRIRNLNQAHKQIIQSIEKARKPTHENKEEHFQSQKQRFLHHQRHTEFKTPNKKKSLENSRFRHQSQTQKLRMHQQSRPEQLSSNPQQFVSLIEPKLLLEYLQKQRSFMRMDSSPNDIFQFFMSICHEFGIKGYFQEPLIKRYKNCVYFGEKVPKYGNYIGFIWYFRKAIYYGDFMGGKKNGYGIQIDLDNRSNFIWRGTFLNGKKTGYFQLVTPELSYHGTVKNSFFDGEGLLKTQKSTFKGTFQAGMKQGYGVETFHTKNLSYKGDYIENKFDGKGVLEGPNYYYTGEFRNNKCHGDGFERTDEFEYVGQFFQGKRSGKGILRMRDGKVYEGLFENGKITNKYQINQKKKQIPSMYTKSIPIKSKLPKHPPKNILLEKHLSKQLFALYEQNEEGTLQQQNQPEFRMYEELDDEDYPLQSKI